MKNFTVSHIALRRRMECFAAPPRRPVLDAWPRGWPRIAGPALLLLFFAVSPRAAEEPFGAAALELASAPGQPAATVPALTPHISADRNGVLATSDGLTLRLNIDLGSVRIIPLGSGAAPVVRYTVHIETDAREPVAKSLLDGYALKTTSSPAGVEISGLLPPQVAHSRGAGAQFWVRYEVAVPPGYHVDVKTGVGDIAAADIGGSAQLFTQGGNITAGHIGARDARKANTGHAEAILQTEGGHIQVQDVSGDLAAFTAGGHIVTGNISGDATLRSGGGHIRVGKIGGHADLQTEGGNITVQHAGNFVNVRTGGGQIDFGEVRGSVHAQTAGGGIRIMYVSGPMNVESSGGSICLTRVAGAVQAATTAGTITAWINPNGSPDAGPGAESSLSGNRDFAMLNIPSASASPVRLAGASQLASGNGDVVVFLPRNLAATIEAVVTSGDASRIIADPAIHFAVQSTPEHAPGAVRAVAILNGGGAPLKLKTASGNIRLQFLDSQVALRDALVRDQIARLNQQLGDLTQLATRAKFDFDFGGNFAPRSVSEPPEPPPAPAPANSRTAWIETWRNALEVAVTGGLREDPADFQKRLTYAPRPAYPALAQTAGIQGPVKLQVRVTKDSQVKIVKVLEGEPVLVDAAIAAVEQWRANPGTLNGKPVEIFSYVTINFQLP